MKGEGTKSGETKEQPKEGAKGADDTQKKLDDLRKDLQKQAEKLENERDNQKNQGTAKGQEENAKKEDSKQDAESKGQKSGSGEQGKDGKEKSPKDGPKGPPEAKKGNASGKENSKESKKDAKNDPDQLGKAGESKSKSDGSGNQPGTADKKTPMSKETDKGKGDLKGANTPTAKKGNGDSKEEPTPSPNPLPKNAERKDAPPSKAKGQGDPSQLPESKTKDGKGEERKGPAPANSKKADPNDSGAEAKGENAAPANSEKSPTPQDVEQLRKDLQAKDGAAESARQKLEELAKTSPDPNIRKAAEKVLENLAKDSQPGKENPKPNAGKKEVDKDGSGGNTSASAKKVGDVDPKNANVGKVAGSGKDSEKNGNPPEGTGNAANNAERQAEAEKANEEFARRLGNLQLEKMTPELLKKAGMTEAEFQQFRAKADEYDKLLRQWTETRKAEKFVSGTGGQLPPDRIRMIQNPMRNVRDPLEAGRAVPPPEILDALRSLSEVKKR